MRRFSMLEVISILGLPMPQSGRSSYNISCPYCDAKPKQKHLNINLKKEVFRCPKCGEHGGIFDLYSLFSGVPRDKVLDDLINRTEPHAKTEHKPKFIGSVDIPDLESPLADIETRHLVYSSLLSKLTLASDHKGNLLNRGLNEEAIARLGYKSTPAVGMTAIAKKIADEGLNPSGVPGFYRLDNNDWTFVNEQRGILIPVCDENKKIQAMQIRHDNVQKRKFRWFSSVDRKDGRHAEGWTHIAGPIRSLMLITEGPMKADIIHELSGHSVIAVPGVNSLTQLKDTIIRLRELGVRELMTAFDMDYLTNPNVQKAFADLSSLLGEIGIPFGIYLWNPEYKGLDDYMHAFLMRFNKSK